MASHWQNEICEFPSVRLLSFNGSTRVHTFLPSLPETLSIHDTHTHTHTRARTCTHTHTHTSTHIHKDPPTPCKDAPGIKLAGRRSWRNKRGLSGSSGELCRE